MIARYSLPEMTSLWKLESKFSYWLKVELALLEARVTLGRLAQSTFVKIAMSATFTVERIKELEAELDHDMIAFVQCVREALRANGVSAEQADEFHKSHTSYDIEDPAFMLQLIESSQLILTSLRRLQNALLAKAKAYKEAWMLWRTHAQFAEPSTFGHLLLVYAEAIGRANADIAQVINTQLRVGKMNGAIGTYAGLDPNEEELACQALGLKPAVVTTQILQRDRHARLMAALTTAAGSIEQIACTFHVMMHSCVRELQEPRKPKQRGSSAMPWKVNPILIERLMGLPRVMRGYAGAAQENVRVLEGRDISQSSVERIVFPDATTLLHYMATKASDMVEGLVIFPDQMANNIERSCGVWAGQRIRYALTDAGLSDEVAYLYIQRVSFKATKTGTHLRVMLGRMSVSDTDTRTAVTMLGQGGLDALFDIGSYVKEGLEVIYKRFPALST